MYVNIIYYKHPIKQFVYKYINTQIFCPLSQHSHNLRAHSQQEFGFFPPTFPSTG